MLRWQRHRREPCKPARALELLQDYFPVRARRKFFQVHPLEPSFLLTRYSFPATVLELKPSDFYVFLLFSLSPKVLKTPHGIFLNLMNVSILIIKWALLVDSSRLHPYKPNKGRPSHHRAWVCTGPDSTAHHTAGPVQPDLGTATQLCPTPESFRMYKRRGDGSDALTLE